MCGGDHQLIAGRGFEVTALVCALIKGRVIKMPGAAHQEKDNLERLMLILED